MELGDFIRIHSKRDSVTLFSKPYTGCIGAIVGQVEQQLGLKRYDVYIFSTDGIITVYETDIENINNSWTVKVIKFLAKFISPMKSMLNVFKRKEKDDGF